jgi:hypothetical protein
MDSSETTFHITSGKCIRFIGLDSVKGKIYSDTDVLYGLLDQMDVKVTVNSKITYHFNRFQVL